MASNINPIQLQSSAVKPEPLPGKQEVTGRSSCEVDGADNQGCTPLHRIFTKSQSSEQDEETMIMLVSLGADIHTKAKNGSGIFHSAVKYNIPAKLLESFVNLSNAKVPVKGIKEEIDNTAKNEFSGDINEVNYEGFTPMHWVAMNGGDSNNNKALLKLLMRLGANINIKTTKEERLKVDDERCNLYMISSIFKNNDGLTALHLAIDNSSSDDEIIKALVQSGVDVNLKTSDDSTALHVAVKKQRSEDVTGCIINAGANMDAVDVAGKTALHYTYTMSYNHRFEQINLATLLVKSGARFDVLDDKNYTPLLAAAIANQTDLVLVMMDAANGCDRNLEAVVPQSYNNYIHTIFGSGVHIKIKGYTALLVAVICLDEAMVEALINGGAFVNALTPDKKNALHVTLDSYSNDDEKLKEARISMAKLLIDSSIDMDGIYSGQTALHMAVTRSEEITRYLIQKGADVNIKNWQGETILHCSIQNNKHDLIKLLLRQYEYIIQAK